MGLLAKPDDHLRVSKIVSAGPPTKICWNTTLAVGNNIRGAILLRMGFLMCSYARTTCICGVSITDPSELEVRNLGLEKKRRKATQHTQSYHLHSTTDSVEIIGFLMR